MAAPLGAAQYTSSPTTATSGTSSAACPTSTTSTGNATPSTCMATTSSSAFGTNGSASSRLPPYGGTGPVGGDQPEGEGSPFLAAPMVVLLLASVAAGLAARRKT
jgi:hypothetical protein